MTVNFKQSDVKTTIKMRGDVIPHVFISEKAINKMYLYTKEAPGQDEIGWLGTVYYNPEANQYYIDDTFLFEQEVHSTTTEITAEGLEKFGMDLLQQPDGIEIWNNLKLWGHSHVNMGVTPSGQDNDQMESFSKTGHDFFIRLICNKKGDMRIDVYDFAKGMEFHQCDWSVVEEVEPDIDERVKELQAKLQDLQEQIKKEKEAKVKELEAPIKAEITQKVKKLVYARPKTNATSYNYSSYPLTGGYNYFANEPVGEFYTEYELKQIARTCFNYQDFLEDIKFDGADLYLSQADIMSLWKRVLDIQANDNFWKEGAQ